MQEFTTLGSVIAVGKDRVPNWCRCTDLGIVPGKSLTTGGPGVGSRRFPYVQERAFSRGSYPG